MPQRALVELIKSYYILRKRPYPSQWRWASGREVAAISYGQALKLFRGNSGIGDLLRWLQVKATRGWGGQPKSGDSGERFLKLTMRVAGVLTILQIGNTFPICLVANTSIWSRPKLLGRLRRRKLVHAC